MNRQDVKSAVGAKGSEPNEVSDRLAYRVIGAAIDVHRELRPGYLGSVDEAALAIKLRERSIPCLRPPRVDVPYKGQTMGQVRLDLLKAGTLIAELKAVDVLLPVHTAQASSYLMAINKQLALLIILNEARRRAVARRVILS